MKDLPALIIELKAQDKKNPHGLEGRKDRLRSLLSALKAGEQSGEPEADPSEAGLEAAIRDLMTALKSENLGEAVAAFRDAHALLCSSCGEGEMEDESVYDSSDLAPSDDD